MITGNELTVILASYLIGCFTVGYYWVRWRTGRDVRHLGSGSVGARNVGRAVGPWGFAITLLGDAAKGALAVGLALHFHVSDEALVAAMAAVVAGHNWPVQLRFHGGKGVATSLGAILAFDPWVALLLALVFLVVFALLRSFTLSGLLAFALSPLAVFCCRLGNVSVAAVAFVAIAVLIAHRKNIRDEFAGWHSASSEKPRPGTRDKGADS